MLAIAGLSRWRSRHDRVGTRCASSALGYLALLLALPVALVFWRTFADGIAP